MTGRSTGRSLWTEAEAQAVVSAGGHGKARLREGRGHRGRAPKMPVYLGKSRRCREASRTGAAM